VHVQIDYTKPATEGFEARDAATVTVGGKNIAHELVERGYASVVRHRKDDEDRSATYDTLLQLEQAYSIPFLCFSQLVHKHRQWGSIRARTQNSQVKGS